MQVIIRIALGEGRFINLGPTTLEKAEEWLKKNSFEEISTGRWNPNPEFRCLFFEEDTKRWQGWITQFGGATIESVQTLEQSYVANHNGNKLLTDDTVINQTHPR